MHACSYALSKVRPASLLTQTISLVCDEDVTQPAKHYFFSHQTPLGLRYSYKSQVDRTRGTEFVVRPAEALMGSM